MKGGEPEAGILVRPMSLADLPEVMRVDAASIPRPWSASLWREELESPFGFYLVLEEGGEVAAHIGLKLVADELHVMTLAVRPGSRRRGHARALVDAAIAAHPEVKRVYLEVRPANVAARRLYVSLGFEVTGRRRRYYGDEDALLMTRDL